MTLMKLKTCLYVMLNSHLFQGYINGIWYSSGGNENPEKSYYLKMTHKSYEKLWELKKSWKASWQKNNQVLKKICQNYDPVAHSSPAVQNLILTSIYWQPFVQILHNFIIYISFYKIQFYSNWSWKLKILQ